MEKYLYLNLIPEALIFSQLKPDQFGKYLAIGDKKLTSGPAMFFSIDPDFKCETINLDAARSKCVSHADGSPRRSSYAAVYHVLANVPVEALRNLYLATPDGLTLELKPGECEPKDSAGLHLYQEICPVTPRVASPLPPREFSHYVTDPSNQIFLPRIVFSELRINGLATDPEGSSTDNLPYRNINHLRECLTSLKYKSDKMTKIVSREMDPGNLYSVIQGGFYVGDASSFVYFPLPGEEELESEHHRWWNSASSVPRF